MSTLNKLTVDLCGVDYKNLSRMVRGRRGRGPPVPSVVDDLCYVSPKRKDSKLEFCTKPQHSTLTTVIGTKAVNAIPTSSRDNEKNNAKVPTEFKTITATKCQSISRFFQVKGRSLCYSNGQDAGLDVDGTNDISVVDLTNEDSCDQEIDNMTKLTDGPSSDDTSCDSGVVVDSVVSVDTTPVRTSPRKNPSTLANARLPRGPRTPHRIGQYCPSTESLDSPPVSPRSKTHLNIANGNIASDGPIQTVPRTSVRNANVRPPIALNVQCNNVVGNNDSLLINGSSSPTSALSQLRIAFPRKNARSRRRLQSNHSENSTNMVVDRLQQQGDPMSKADVVNPALCPRPPKTLTDYFPVRRSVRKTKKAVLEERQRDIEQAIIKKQEDGLEVHNFPDKGRGIVALRKFLRGSFVLEYTGDLISLSEAKDREELYAKDENTGCYMYYFKHKNKQYCIDATPESGKLGRLVNHSRNGNLLTKTVQIGSTPHLVLIAKDDIHPGEEVCYDYGDRSKESLQHHPWLAL